VISRPGWTKGSALAFLINGTGHRTADAADKVGGVAPVLTINYRLELPLGSYARWAAAYTNAAFPMEDPDGDGYENLVEYALALHPAVAERGALQLSVDATSLHFTYTRPVAVTDVSYQVEWAVTLGSTWHSAGVTQRILSDNGAIRTLGVTIPKGITSQRFVRLKVAR
jgi:hypothetical protein